VKAAIAEAGRIAAGTRDGIRNTDVFMELELKQLDEAKG
jgi:hypothetical protein